MENVENLSANEIKLGRLYEGSLHRDASYSHLSHGKSANGMAGCEAKQMEWQNIPQQKI